MSELKNALRSGDVWVAGSRQFRDFDEYLLPRADYAVRVSESRLGLEIPTIFEIANRFTCDALAVCRRARQCWREVG